jgi:cytochrome c553
MKQNYFLIAIFAILMISCKSKIENATYSEFQKKGNEIATLTQTVLLANVGEAMQKGGPVYALEFCNLKASAITDSLNAANNCTISRVSAKNRNPENDLKTAADKNLWAIFEAGTLNDTVIQQSKTLVYYKPIKTALPACLKCHGELGTDIDSTTTAKLNMLYPKDLATGYKLNDFRGLWKIEFSVD